jgi:hypothetical protein
MAGEECFAALGSLVLQTRGMLQLHLALVHYARPDDWRLQQLQVQVVDLGWWRRVSQLTSVQRVVQPHTDIPSQLHRLEQLQHRNLRVRTSQLGDRNGAIKHNHGDSHALHRHRVVSAKPSQHS